MFKTAICQSTFFLDALYQYSIWKIWNIVFVFLHNRSKISSEIWPGRGKVYQWSANTSFIPNYQCNFFWWLHGYNCLMEALFKQRAEKKHWQWLQLFGTPPSWKRRLCGNDRLYRNGGCCFHDNVKACYWFCSFCMDQRGKNSYCWVGSKCKYLFIKYLCTYCYGFNLLHHKNQIFFGYFIQVELHQNDDLQRKMSQMRSLNDNVCLYEKPPSTLELKVKVILSFIYQKTDLCPIHLIFEVI